MLAAWSLTGSNYENNCTASSAMLKQCRWSQTEGGDGSEVSPLTGSFVVCKPRKEEKQTVTHRMMLARYANSSNTQRP